MTGAIHRGERRSFRLCRDRAAASRYRAGRIETMAACRVATRGAAIRKVELVDGIEIERRLFSPLLKLKSKVPFIIDGA
ncbi:MULTISPECIES: hypothetical protein [Burkholderia]|uniref:hypothetical protein n=1 Tax=Burkholderia TaxID=32008 RepID=UPI0012D2EB55|nr:MULTISPECIES: hypothetical protein [Burkholderia]